MTVRTMIGNPRPTVRPAAIAPVLLPLLSSALPSPTVDVSEGITVVVLVDKRLELVVIVSLISNELVVSITLVVLAVVLVIVVTLLIAEVLEGVVLSELGLLKGVVLSVVGLMKDDVSLSAVGVISTPVEREISMVTVKFIVS